MAGRSNGLNNENLLKILLLAVSFISLVTGITVFTGRLIKSRAAAAEASEKASEAEETDSEEPSQEEASAEGSTESEDVPADSAASDTGENDTGDTSLTDSAVEEAGQSDLTEDEKTALEEELKEKELAEADASASSQKYSTDYIYGVFIASDPDVTRAFAPTIAFNKDHTFEMTLNFDDNMKTYKGSYTTSTKQNEMDDLYVYLTIDNPSNGISDKATVVFSDSPDYCMFMDDGFGLMGYSGAPYYFNRDERE